MLPAPFGELCQAWGRLGGHTAPWRLELQRVFSTASSAVASSLAVTSLALAVFQTGKRDSALLHAV